MFPVFIDFKTALSISLMSYVPVGIKETQKKKAFRTDFWMLRAIQLLKLSLKYFLIHIHQSLTLHCGYVLKKRSKKSKLRFSTEIHVGVKHKLQRHYFLKRKLNKVNKKSTVIVSLSWTKFQCLLNSFICNTKYTFLHQLLSLATVLYTLKIPTLSWSLY